MREYTALVATACLLTSISEVFAQQTHKFDILRCFTPCTGGFTGIEIIPSTGCKWYHECWNGVIKDRQECGSPLVYNEELDYCDFPRNVNCLSGNFVCPKDMEDTGNLFLNLPAPATPNPTRKPTRKPRTKRPTPRPTTQQPSTRIPTTTPPAPTPTTTRPIAESPSMIPTKEPTTPWPSQQPAFSITIPVGPPQQQQQQMVATPKITTTTTTTYWPSQQPAASPLLQTIVNGSPRAMGLVENAGAAVMFPRNKVVFVYLLVTSTVHIILAW